MKIPETYEDFEKIVGKDVAGRIVMERIMEILAKSRMLDEIMGIIEDEGTTIGQIREIIWRER